MQRVINAAEHNLFADPPKIVTVAAATATAILDNEVGVATGEIAYRYIQNLTAGDLYYSFGQANPLTAPPSPNTNNTINFHGILPQYAQLDCSNHRLRVDVYSVAGATVSATVIRRRDLSKHRTVTPI